MHLMGMNIELQSQTIHFDLILQSDDLQLFLCSADSFQCLHQTDEYLYQSRDVESDADCHWNLQVGGGVGHGAGKAHHSCKENDKNAN